MGVEDLPKPKYYVQLHCNHNAQSGLHSYFCFFFFFSQKLLNCHNYKITLHYLEYVSQGRATGSNLSAHIRHLVSYITLLFM